MWCIRNIQISVLELKFFLCYAYNDICLVNTFLVNTEFFKSSYWVWKIEYHLIWQGTEKNVINVHLNQNCIPLLYLFVWPRKLKGKTSFHPFILKFSSGIILAQIMFSITKISATKFEHQWLKWHTEKRSFLFLQFFRQRACLHA